MMDDDTLEVGTNTLTGQVIVSVVRLSVCSLNGLDAGGNTLDGEGCGQVGGSIGGDEAATERLVFGIVAQLELGAIGTEQIGLRIVGL
jgi:hypothetical protein